MGIFRRKRIPKPDAICFSCTKPIWLKNEASGLLHVASGKPICAVCRVLRGNTKGSNAIIKTRKDIAEKKQKDANENVIKVAIVNQKQKEVEAVSISNTKKKD